MIAVKKIKKGIIGSQASCSGVEGVDGRMFDCCLSSRCASSPYGREASVNFR